ncbi:MAG: flagellar basal body P-ring protein FlgI [Phycisphaerales bacterium]|jgi:flagellar basal body P-ring protein FlgI|nr:flagellar basal body P-ring protein FlgI [Phycisphaerales bacterium]
MAITRCLNPIHVTLAAILAAGCSSVEKARPRPQASSTIRELDGMETASIMRGTVGAETVILGWDDSTSPTYRPVRIRGYGLVVGLEGTGSRDVPPNVRAHMLQLMARQGIGSERIGFGDISPESMLDSQNTAIVIVEGVVPPGAVGRRRTPPSASGRLPEMLPGTTFDVHVHADPRTGTTSLEGGRLYTTDLSPGPLLTGDRQARILGQAAGPIFLNPFLENENVSAGDINTLHGRILNGGQVLEDMPLKLRMINPSHSRVRIVQDAINRRFPLERGQARPTAHAVNDAAIELTVPPSMREKPNDFVHIVRHITLRQVDTDRVANTIRRSLQRDPSEAASAYWRWVAMGPQALPMVRKMYDYPEALPRLAALRAGAELGDAIAAESLRRMLKGGTLAERLEATTLLAKLPSDPRTEDVLRSALNDESVEVRLRAYEALEQLRSPIVHRHLVPGRFELHQIPSAYPAIYVTQVRAPRIVVLGEDVPIERPMTLGMWENSLLMRESKDGARIEVFHRVDPGGPPEVNQVAPVLREMILLLGHAPTIEDPAAGLGLSYSKVVGVLHALWKRQYVAADFKAQQDRVLAELRRAATTSNYQPRPE